MTNSQLIELLDNKIDKAEQRKKEIENEIYYKGNYDNITELIKIEGKLKAYEEIIYILEQDEWE